MWHRKKSTTRKGKGRLCAVTKLENNGFNLLAPKQYHITVL
jgi:hypothetical protein